MFGALGFYSAKGMTVVPGVIGQTQATAQTNLINVNLTSTTTTLNTNVESQGGTVGSQSPSPGELVDYGTNVSIGIYSYVALPQISSPQLSQARTSSTTANVSITNYDSSVSYSISFGASGSATFSDGVFFISGISSNGAFSATVYANKSGFSGSQGSISVSQWEESVYFGGSLTVSSTGTSSITLSASIWNPSTFSTAWYCTINGSSFASGGMPPQVQQSNPLVTSFTASGLSASTSYSFSLYVGGQLVSSTTGTTGSTPPPVSETWYCRTFNSNGQSTSTYISSSNESDFSSNCNNIIFCRLTGYPTTSPGCELP
jgi:hypothetical protein